MADRKELPVTVVNVAAILDGLVKSANVHCRRRHALHHRTAPTSTFSAPVEVPVIVASVNVKIHSSEHFANEVPAVMPSVRFTSHAFRVWFASSRDRPATTRLSSALPMTFHSSSSMCPLCPILQLPFASSECRTATVRFAIINSATKWKRTSTMMSIEAVSALNCSHANVR